MGKDEANVLAMGLAAPLRPPNIFLVFMGGSSTMELISIHTSRQAAEEKIAEDSKLYVQEYMDNDNGEYVAIE